MKKTKKPAKNAKSAIKKEILIVKRKGHEEPYDEKKVYGSAYFACRNAHLSEIESEIISEKVSKEIHGWAGKQNSLTSDDIFRKLAEVLRRYNEDASFLYETHRDIC